MELQVCRIAREHTSRINSVDFSKDGELLLSSGDDDLICLYSCQQGMLQKLVQCTKYGADLARFTHDPLSVLVASRKARDGTVRYLSLHDNRYLRNFEGHTDSTVALEMSPKEDFFASASLDGTARIWDLRTSSCQGIMKFGAGAQRLAVAFDPHGLVFATTTDASNQTKLFDVRAYEKGPFVTFEPDLGGSTSFSYVKFSHDGKFMLLSTTQGRVALLDAFSGDLMQTYSGHANEHGIPLEACFSPDAKYVISGSEDGIIRQWLTRSGEQLKPLKAHDSSVTVLKCNPTRMMLASASSTLCLWLPH